MTRRELLALAGGWATSTALRAGQHPGTGSRRTLTQFDGAADVSLRIGEVTWDLAPGRSIRTIAYNGQVPGPLLRARVGRPFTVDVWNDTREMDIVHWHGLHIPSEVDGAYEEGTPGVPSKGRERYAFTPQPSGTHWYHSHNPAGKNLSKSTYSGQFGMFVVDSDADPGAYDVEVPILLHEWDARLTRHVPVDVEYRHYSVNGRMLGADEPIRVRESQRVLFRMVNASATLPHRLALSGHTFNVIALDGHAVAKPGPAPVVELAPGERVDAIVEMNRPGVWVLGEVNADQRTRGMGVVVEYAGRSGPPRWELPPPFTWEYTLFGSPVAAPDPDERMSFVFKAHDDGLHWRINGKSHPKTDPIVVRAGRRYRWLLDNQSGHHHPIHLHRHVMELVRFDGRPVSGIRKDVVLVPAWKQLEVDVRTTNPGLTLFHCHHQLHMDMGFMALMRYAP